CRVLNMTWIQHLTDLIRCCTQNLRASLGGTDNGLALSNRALQGVDLWMEKKMRKVFFMSDHLVQALKSEKLSQTLKPYRCRVIEQV
ncbi:hypothetical protein, partial [Onishia taeanensis]|uniref:hypothetical protein n=1 Tax=Onishia taeanensis TaxID=284577 RepID=UPI001C2E100E